MPFASFVQSVSLCRLDPYASIAPSRNRRSMVSRLVSSSSISVPCFSVRRRYSAIESALVAPSLRPWSIDVGDRFDRGVAFHDERLVHEEVGLRELHRPGAFGVVSNEADLGLAVSNGIDYALRVRLADERHLHAARTFELAREIDNDTADFAVAGSFIA